MIYAERNYQTGKYQIYLCEQCAEAGYAVCKKYNDAECNVELLERRLIKELEMLYNKFMVENI